MLRPLRPIAATTKIWRRCCSKAEGHSRRELISKVATKQRPIAGPEFLGALDAVPSDARHDPAPSTPGAEPGHHRPCWAGGAGVHAERCAGPGWRRAACRARRSQGRASSPDCPGPLGSAWSQGPHLDLDGGTPGLLDSSRSRRPRAGAPAALDVRSRCVVVRLTPHGGTRYGTGSPRQRHDDGAAVLKVKR